MNKIINFTVAEKKILKLERAISDLRNGFPVIYVNNETKLLCFATDYLTPASFAGIANNHLNLSIANKRLEFITGNKHTKHGSVQLITNNLSEVKNLILAEKPELDNFQVDYKYSDDLAIIHKFFVEAEIIPSVCFVIADEYDPDLIELDYGLIALYTKIITSDICLSVETILQLNTTKPVKIRAYNPKYGGTEHYAIIIGNPELDANPLVRIHSSCYTGDLLGSLSCDCGDQLKLAIKTMDESPEFHGGILIYLIQEGRGIGLTNKLRAYELQSKGLDTVEANIALGFPVDARKFVIADKILDDLKINSLTLLTNNPRKSEQLSGFGKKIVATISLVIKANEHNKEYLDTKSKKLGHSDLRNH